MGMHLSRGVDYEIYILDIDDHSGDMFLPGRFRRIYNRISCIWRMSDTDCDL